MSDTPTPAENTPEGAPTDAPPAKSKKMLIIIGLVVLLGGGAGGFFMLRGKTAAGDEKAAKKGEAGKKSKGHAAEEEEEEEAETGHTEGETKATPGKEGSGKEGDVTTKPQTPPMSATKSIRLSLPEDEDVKHVLELQSFIVNLADDEQPRYLRLTLSVGIGGEDGAEEKPDPLFITRVRNAILAVLTTKKSEEILSIEGKSTLRKEILKAAQRASEEPKVIAIYITDFIVQM